MAKRKTIFTGLSGLSFVADLVANLNDTSRAKQSNKRYYASSENNGRFFNIIQFNLWTY